jgi:uncharacterized protein YecT (DUF1311 family)
MRSLVIVVILFVVGYRGYGQNSAEFKGCIDKAQTQAELNICASDEAARANSALVAAYEGFLAKIAGDPLATAKLRKAEAAWLRYRDAYMEAVFPAQDKQLAYGTEFPMDFDLLLVQMTREHLAAIEYLINEYQPTQ